MNRFINKHKVVISDKRGIISKTNVTEMTANVYKKKQKKKQNSKNQQRKHPSENSHQRELDCNEDTGLELLQAPNETVFYSLKTKLSYPNQNNILLSGSLDDTQICVVKNDNGLSVVVVKKVDLLDGTKFISGCSNCFNIESDFLIYLENSSIHKIDEASKIFKCSHIIDSVATILENFGAWRPTIGEDELQEFLQSHCTWHNAATFFYTENHPAFCVSINSIDGILLFCLKNGKWRCVFDNYQKTTKCRHGHLIEIDEDMSFENHKKNEVKLTPSLILNKKQFSVSHLSEFFMQRQWNLEKFIKENFAISSETGFIKIMPEKSVCEFCSETLLMSKLQPIGVLLVPFLLNCEVYAGVCTNQNCVNYKKGIYYSGISKGIVNYNNKFFICVELVKEYFELYSKNGIKFTSWIKTKMNLYNFGSQAPLYKSIVKISSYYGLLHEAFCAVTELFIYNDEDFVCCKNPEVVQIDATVNSIKMCRMPPYKKPWINNSVVKRASLRTDRQLSQLNAIEKKIVRNIIVTGNCSIPIYEQLKNHTHIGLKVLSYCLIKHDEFCILDKPAEMFCNTLIKMVAASSCIVSASCVEILSRIISVWKISLDDNVKLKVECPTLNGVYSSINKIHPNDETAKKTFKILLQELLEKRKRTFRDSFENFEDVSEKQYETLIEEMGNKDCCSTLPMLDLINTGCFFPGHRIVKKIDEIGIKNDDSFCNKIYKQPGSLAPGVLYFFCVKHQHCFGFVVLQNAESPKLIAELFLTRFEIIPRTILYDNCCNLSEFILNRYPVPFSDSTFYVDGFHYSSHVNCAPCYNASGHPGSTKSLNTSLVEQKNSQLRYLKQTSPYLKFITFCYKLVYSTFVINQKKNNN